MGRNKTRGGITHSQKDGGYDGPDNKGGDESLEENGVLDLTKSGFFNPNFTVKDFADDIALLILGDPGFIFIAVARSQGIE